MLKDVISGCMKDVVLVDSGAVGAEDMAGALLDLGTAADRSRAGRHTFFVTDSTEGFEKQASIFLETEEHLSVSRVDLN
jgi:glutamate racemase